MSDVVKGTFGPVLLKVTKIDPAVTKPLSDVSTDIRHELALDEASKDALRRARRLRGCARRRRHDAGSRPEAASAKCRPSGPSARPAKRQQGDRRQGPARPGGAAEAGVRDRRQRREPGPQRRLFRLPLLRGHRRHAGARPHAGGSPRQGGRRLEGAGGPGPARQEGGRAQEGSRRRQVAGRRRRRPRPRQGGEARPQARRQRCRPRHRRRGGGLLGGQGPDRHRADAVRRRQDPVQGDRDVRAGCRRTRGHRRQREAELRRGYRQRPAQRDGGASFRPNTTCASTRSAIDNSVNY